MIWEIFVCLFVSALLWNYFNRKKRTAALSKAGLNIGPLALPFIGNGLIAIGMTTTKIFDVLQCLRNKYGKVYRLWLLHECIILIQDPRYFESVLSSQQLIKKNNFYNALHCWLGDGLLVSTGKKWHSRRKVITPTFHFKILEQFVEVFDQQSSVLVKKLYARADGKMVINMFPVICLTALDIIAETAMGVKINAQENPDFSYAQALTDATALIATRLMRPEYRYDWLFKLIGYKSYRLMKKNIKIMHDFTDKVIMERRESLEKSIRNGSFVPLENQINELGQKRRLAFLDVLLQSSIDGKPLTNADISEEVDTFMFEGHDTTTSAISHTLYLIARHSEVQNNAFAEIRQVIGDDKDKPITMRELQELKYLDCVIKESLRLYPSVPIIGRMTTEDVALGDKTLPANVQIILLIYAACRDPDYFYKPNEFVPERFADESYGMEEKLNTFAYVPFSAGPRNCIGQKFAILEVKAIISKILRNFELLPLGPDVVPVMNLVLRSANGICLGLKPRMY